MSFFAGKVVIFTGSSNGIGRDTAALFAKQGAKVTGRSATSLEETKQQLLKAGAKEEDILEIIGDVTDEAVLEKLVSATVEKFGKLDVLVNNAGGSSYEHLGKRILDIPVDDFSKMIDLNVKPVLRISQLAVPQLEKTKGTIVNVSSISAYHKLDICGKPIITMPYYSASKSALDQITIQMAGSLIKKGIRVNSVNPGPVLTNFFASSDATPKEPEKIWASLAANPFIPLGRIGYPEEIGKIIFFLADRSQSEILIGNIVTADGGVMLKSALFNDE